MTRAAKNGFKMDNTKAEFQTAKHGRPAPWSDEFVEEVKGTLSTCRILYGKASLISRWLLELIVSSRLSLTVFYLCVNQMVNNFISQAGQMEVSILCLSLNSPTNVFQALRRPERHDPSDRWHSMHNPGSHHSSGICDPSPPPYHSVLNTPHYARFHSLRRDTWLQLWNPTSDLRFTPLL